MALQAPPTHRHEVQVLTADFQFSGQLETVGPVGNFINDPTRDSMALYDVRVTPLTPNSPLGPVSRSHVVVRKQAIVLLYLTSAESRASVHALARSELLVAYTPVAVCRGQFHMPTEANLNEFLGVTPGEFLPITDAQVFPLVLIPDPFPTTAEVLLLGRAHLQLYHPA